MAHVLIIGGGIAGLWTAVRAADTGHSVELVTKTVLADANTSHAQGGIAAALFPDDSAERHYADTIAAGAGLADPAAVRVLCEEGPARVRDLIRFGVEFDRGESGLERGLEAAHSRARIVHAGGDATGAAIESALVATVRRRAVRIDDETMLVDLIVEHGRAVGARLLATTGDVIERRADAIVLATGGSGCLYRHTTNPAVATGDGVAAAWRAGAAVADLEFVQFHPTALAAPGTPLISEAVRGEGAVLRDAAGHRFMLDVDPRGELAPRDVVARAVWRRMSEQGGAPVLLDATALGASTLANRFPGLDAACRNAGYDWANEPVPIIPAAHYAMGGMVTDLDGRTTLPGLFAVGETARAGVHGANRLASNSLLEAAVFADRAARALASPSPRMPNSGVGRLPEVAPVPAPATGLAVSAGTSARRAGSEAATNRVSADSSCSSAADSVTVAEHAAAFSRVALQALMWEHVGLERDEAGLAAASAVLDAWNAPEPTDRHAAEDRNLLDLARLTVAAALARRASVGAHFRSDDRALDDQAGVGAGAATAAADHPTHELEAA